jgi:hypothetical protein
VISVSRPMHGCWRISLANEPRLQRADSYSRMLGEIGAQQIAPPIVASCRPSAFCSMVPSCTPKSIKEAISLGANSPRFKVKLARNLDNVDHALGREFRCLCQCLGAV